MDLFSRRIVGFTYGRDMTETLVIKVFSNALMDRNVYEGLTVHTDLGRQFTVAAFEEILVSVGAKHLYSRKATPYDNAIIESFHASFKKRNITFFQRITALLNKHERISSNTSRSGTTALGFIPDSR